MKKHVPMIFSCINVCKKQKCETKQRVFLRHVVEHFVVFIEDLFLLWSAEILVNIRTKKHLSVVLHLLCFQIQKISVRPGRFKLTDTLIETWVTLIYHVGIYTDSPSSLLFNEIQKKKKTKQTRKTKKKQNEYCSEAVLKVRYIIYTENKMLLNFFLFPGEKKKK